MSLETVSVTSVGEVESLGVLDRLSSLGVPDRLGGAFTSGVSDSKSDANLCFFPGETGSSGRAGERTVEGGGNTGVPDRLSNFGVPLRLGGATTSEGFDSKSAANLCFFAFLFTDPSEGCSMGSVDIGWPNGLVTRASSAPIVALGILRDEISVARSMLVAA